MPVRRERALCYRKMQSYGLCRTFRWNAKEAIARFDPATMTEDEPEVVAKPFPKQWLWILGLYAAAIVVMGCVGVMVL